MCEFCDRENEPSITELHLINNSEEVCNTLTAVFERASKQSSKSIQNDESPVMLRKSSKESPSPLNRKTFTSEGKQEVNNKGATPSTQSSDNSDEKMDNDKDMQQEIDDDDDNDDDDDQTHKKSDQARKGNLIIYEN